MKGEWHCLICDVIGVGGLLGWKRHWSNKHEEAS